MDILFVATELAPYVKVGGLGDVIAALTKSLRQLGHKVTLAMPKFRPLEEGGLLLARRLTPMSFRMGDATVEVTVYDGRLASGVELLLFDAPGLYDRPAIYGEEGKDYPDNAYRFAVFARATAEVLQQRAALGQPFDVVHLHDWPAALLPLYIKQLAPDNRALSGKFVLTVHNLAHQGLFPKGVLPSLGLPWELFHPESLEFFGQLNLLKGGLLFADRLTTVSPTYAREIQLEEQGSGLDGVLRAQRDKLTGITNGIDYATWNPATDPTIVARFDAEDARNKERCKTAVVREMGLELVEGRPLVVFVGRMVAQKGVDLLQSIVTKLMKTDISLAVAGDGLPKLVDKMEALARKYPEKIAFAHKAPEALVHRLFAGADFVVVPSRFEPCGLVQLYAQRYGALPIARSTGGLRDTIVDCDGQLETGTGFLFEEPTGPALLGGMQRAIAAFSSPRFASLRRRVMRLDLGWDRAARRYEQIYRSLS